MAQMYMASGLALTPAATPTDVITISGAANTVVRVLNIRALIHTTAASLILAHWIKRSAANTGGTATQATAISIDSGREGAKAVINIYTANPATLGTAVGTLGNQYLTTTVPTSVPGVMQLNAIGGSTGFNAFANDSLVKPVTLRGAAESVCLNFNGATLAAGFIIAAWDVQWTEEYA
jgi:hypothetical protein